MLPRVPDGQADPLVGEQIEIRSRKCLHRRVVVAVTSYSAGIDTRDKIGAGGSERPGGDVQGNPERPEDDRVETDHPEPDAKEVERPAGLEEVF